MFSTHIVALHDGGLTQRPITCTVVCQLTLQYMVSLQSASYCLKQRQHVSVLAINKLG